MKFISEFGYIIVLPGNWAEYDDEKNTNAFFDTTEWTGNLRITPIKIDPKKGSELLEHEMNSFEGKAEKLKTQNGFEGLKYSEESGEDFIYYWYVIIKDKMFICSFTINLIEKETKKNGVELTKVTKIIDSIKLE
ncbi:DUF3805 domain-containing protein [Flavobacterium sp. ZB4P13]|uniref:DUF3805 domain-containing protein n=1 Tax=Flavobacterium sp. ZB4P13 TaxID=3401728 RepID=UPI003AB0E5BF